MNITDPIAFLEGYVGDNEHARRALAMLKERFAASEKQRWIPVAERLPEGVYAAGQQSEDVLVLHNNAGDPPEQTVAHYWHESKQWVAPADERWTHFEYQTITHWMPLPEAPHG